MHSLEGKIAVVTGGTSGIGLEVAKNFVASGARVTITGRRPEGESIAADIGAAFEQCDAADETQVAAGLRNIEDEYGKLDILVINAGVAADEESLESFSTMAMERLVDVNLKGVFLAMKYGPCHMNDGGSIITTGSVAGAGTTNAGSAVYSASKAGVVYLTRTCSIELASRGIRANTVCPAVIAGTGVMTDDDGSEDARLMASLTAFGRMGRLDEVVGAYNFLASDASTFITGQELRIDGGMTAGIGVPMFESLAASIDRAPQRGRDQFG
jgi:NAD(P)-dependent dehydrogenase (short-subunit alcohol dehydrogenase family)